MMQINPRQTTQGIPPSPRDWYRSCLDWGFAIFNSTRILTYIPTMWAIHVNGDSRQYSLVTWLAWVGANASMALWLYEHKGRRIDKAIVINASNAAMCLATCVLIWFYQR